MTDTLPDWYADYRRKAEARRLDATEFARRIGVQHESFARWMSGAWEPRLSALRRAFQAFGYDIRVYTTDERKMTHVRSVRLGDGKVQRMPAPAENVPVLRQSA